MLLKHTVVAVLVGSALGPLRALAQENVAGKTEISSSGLAQSSASLLGASYAKPSPFIVAPGQIVTFFFRGVGPMPSGSTRFDDAKTLPLPETLAGLSLKISQTGVASPLPVPLVSVRQEIECDAASWECYLAAACSNTL